MWACPHCRHALHASTDGATFACVNRHSFDRASEGYVNLLPPNRKRTREPGDNPLMVAARRRVHDSNVYRPLADALVGELTDLPVAGAVLDLGCGEGYYCDALSRAMPASRLLGIDISRPAVRMAAKRVRAANFAVASAYQLPLLDASLEAIVRVFAPSDDAEVTRVLKPGQFYLEVCPAPRHLWQVRARLYDTPREHATARMDIAGLQLLRQHSVQYEVVPDPALLADIISMTPFAHRGHREKRDSLREATLPKVTLAFSLHLFQASL